MGTEDALRGTGRERGQGIKRYDGAALKAKSVALHLAPPRRSVMEHAPPLPARSRKYAHASPSNQI